MKLLTNKKTIKYTLPIGLVIGFWAIFDMFDGRLSWFTFFFGLAWGLGNFMVIQSVVDTLTGIHRRKKKK